MARGGSGLLGPGWVRPYWLERQADPSSPAFVPLGDPPVPVNLTARNWTTIGTTGSPWKATVDPRGLVTPWPGGWSLDWWVGADDRWHLPSREGAVRQRLVEDAPVVETAMRIPGGDVVHRAYAVQAGPEAGGAGLVVVEVENATPVPVALAFSVRPYHPEGLARLERIEYVDGTVLVDGRVAMVLARPPARMATSTTREGDCATVVLAGQAGPTAAFGDRDPGGLATAAFVVPLPHTASARVVLPLAPLPPTRRRALIRRPARVAGAPSVAGGLPGAAAVARGWRAHAGRGMGLVLPDERLAACVEAQRRFLLLLHDGDRITTGGAARRGFGLRDAVFVLGALDRFGYAAEAAEVLRRYPDRQRPDGSFAGPAGADDANGRALVALAEHWRLHRDGSLLEAAVPTVVKGAERIERRRHRRQAGAEVAESLWGVGGLRAAGELLAAAGEGAGAAVAARYAEAFLADLEAAYEPEALGSLVGCWPLRLWDPDHRRAVDAADLVRRRLVVGEAVAHGDGGRGLGTAATLQLAMVELESGEPRALDRLAWMVDAATPTWTWPEAVHPRLGGGSFGDGHSGRVAADLLTFVRHLLVRETAGGLALCTLLPGGWRGAGIEVHDAPTHAGVLSFAVRWHGDRPALLWDLVPHAGAGPVRLTAPGLDPSWSSTERAGDALLAPLPPSTGRAVAAPEGSFS